MQIQLTTFIAQNLPFFSNFYPLLDLLQIILINIKILYFFRNYYFQEKQKKT